MKAFIIFRDRVTYAKMCFGALWSAGLKVHVVDHDSTWPPAVAWLAELDSIGIPVYRRGRNCYPWELWKWEVFREVMWGDTEPYVVTDPDVVPSADCPQDWVRHLAEVLNRNPCVKAGLGLRLDKIPPARLEKIEKWESGFWHDMAEPGVFRANVDTTLALYRPFSEYPLFSLGPSLRLGHPYVADHLAWYEDGELSPELQYYHARADPGHHIVRSLKDLNGRCGVPEVAPPCLATPSLAPPCLASPCPEIVSGQSVFHHCDLRPVIHVTSGLS